MSLVPKCNDQHVNQKKILQLKITMFELREHIPKQHEHEGQ
jgi:hypothetical protein